MAATITPGYTLTLGEDYDPVFINAILNALTIGSIIGAEIAAGTILGSNIASGTIEGSNIAAATITGTNIVADAIGATHIASNSISADDIQTDAITATKIIAGAITTDKIAALAVTTDKIEALAITSAKIAADAIESSHIASNTIEADMIKTDAVTAVKIQAAAVTSDKIYAGAVTSDKISVNSLDAISANLGTVTSGTVTAATVQTSADPAVSRVKMYAGGLYGYDAVLGNTFRLPTDGTAPYFASGNIISGTITNTTIVTNDFKTSSSLPWIELTASGLALRISGSGGLYDTGVYDTATYGAGVTAYLGNSAKPFLSMETATTLADIRFFNRDAVPAGAAEIGDVAFVLGTLRACTTAGTPGTYKTVAFTDSAITSSMFIGTTSVALNRASAALTLAGITLTTPDIGTPSAGTLTNCTFPTLNQNTTGYASALKSATTTVDVAAATAPSTGQVLKATDSTHATWQTAAAGDVATDAIWDAAGDLVYGTGANTASRLAAGATTTILVGGGAAAPVWTTATGTGAPVRAESPTFTTKITTPIIDLTGGQIAFPAIQAASAGANTLDDYEEGTWTPGVAFGGGTTGMTYDSQTGIYTKVGRLINCTGWLQMSNNGSSTGNATFTGLPFASNTNAYGGRFTMPLFIYNGLSFTSTSIPSVYGAEGSATMNIVEVAITGTSSSLTHANFADATYIVFSITYQTAT